MGRRQHHCSVCGEPGHYVTSHYRMDGESPDIWDGQTVYATLPRLHDVRLVCMLCARDVFLQLTESDMKQLGQRRCACGARMLLEHEQVSQRKSTLHSDVVRNPPMAETHI